MEPVAALLPPPGSDEITTRTGPFGEPTLRDRHLEPDGGQRAGRPGLLGADHLGDIRAIERVPACQHPPGAGRQ